VEGRLEIELQRTARSLHDEVQQQLALVTLSLDDLRRSAPSALAPHIAHTLRQIDEVAEHVRSLSRDLRPRVLDELGLVPALERLARGCERRHGLGVVVFARSIGRLPPEVETVLYRTAQEALANATRHGAATHAEVRVERSHDVVRLMAHDDGRGFEPTRPASAADPGRGLARLQARLERLEGALHVESGPGRGTRVTATIPLAADDERSTPAVA
jgi:signal transduction histidine kinase